MTNYLIRRVVGLVPLLLGISLISFGDDVHGAGRPDVRVLGELASDVAGRDREHPAQSRSRQAVVRAVFLVDRQYAARGLRVLVHRRPPRADEDHRKGSGHRAQLIGVSFFFTILIAIPTAVYSAVHKDSVVRLRRDRDRVHRLRHADVLARHRALELFSVKLAPAAGLRVSRRSTRPASTSATPIRHLVLPVATLTFVSLAIVDPVSSARRCSRCSAKTTSARQRQKGYRATTVIYKHAFRNALLPVITLVGLYLPALLTGAYFVEIVFSIPGMGYLGLNAIFERDYPTVMGITIFSAVARRRSATCSRTSATPQPIRGSGTTSDGGDAGGRHTKDPRRMPARLDATDIWRRFARNRLALVGLALVVVLLVVCGVFAPLLSQLRPEHDRHESIMGTPQHAVAGATCSAPTTTAATISRACSSARASRSRSDFRRCSSPSRSARSTARSPAFYGGWVDSVMMRFVDMMLSFPTFFLILDGRGADEQLQHHRHHARDRAAVVDERRAARARSDPELARARLRIRGAGARRAETAASCGVICCRTRSRRSSWRRRSRSATTS